MVVAVIALVLALSGTAFAALGKNSVGSKQIKAKAITSGKIANNAITAAKVADHSLTGADINVGALGTVPAATNAANAGNANTVGGHGASCPGATTLIRGLCFDSASNPAVGSLAAASEACAAKGGYLPGPMALASTHNQLNLGSGTGTEHQYTDEVYANTSGSNYSTVVISDVGTFKEISATSPSQYICAYQLVR